MGILFVPEELITHQKL